MTLDILTSCNGHISKIESLLDCLAMQTVQPDRVLILIYTKITKDEHDMFLYYLQRRYEEDFFAKIITFSHLNSDHVPWQWHWYDRQFLMQRAKSDWSFCIDNDNVFDDTLVESLLWRSVKLEKFLDRGVIVSPTIMRRKSWKVQSQWMRWFRYWMPKYRFAKMDAENRQEVQMIWWNSLLGPTKLMKQVWFDERFAYSYEDIDFSYRCWSQGTPIVVLNKTETYHMERKKNVLEELFLGDPKTARYRSRNRVLFVKKNASDFERIQYLWFGLRWQTFWFFVKIALHWKWISERVELRKAVWKWTIEWLRSN